MNFKIFSFLFLLIIAFSACKKDEKRNLLTNRIEYDVLIDNEDSMEPWMNNIALPDRMILLEFLFNQLDAGLAIDSLGNIIENANVEQIILNTDSNLLIAQGKLFALVQNGQINVNGLRFREKWTYSPDNYCIYKKVLAVCPLMMQRDTNGSFSKIIPLFWIEADTSEMEYTNKLSNLIISDSIVQNTTQAMIRLYGESPYFFSNLDQEYRDKYFLGLKDMVTSHELYGLDYFFNDMAVVDIDKLRDHIDTVYLPDENNDLEAVPVEKKILPKEFARLKFVEKWEYSTDPFTFHKTVMGVNPSLYVEDDYEIFQGYKPLFWVVFDDDDLEFIRGKYSL